MTSVPARKESVAVANAVVNLFSKSPQVHPYRQSLNKITTDALELHNIDLVSVGSSLFTPDVLENLKAKIKACVKPIWVKYLLLLLSSVVISTIILIGFYFGHISDIMDDSRVDLYLNPGIRNISEFSLLTEHFFFEIDKPCLFQNQKKI